MENMVKEIVNVSKLFKKGLDRAEIKCYDLAIDFNKFGKEEITYSLDNQKIGFTVMDVNTGNYVTLREMDILIPIYTINKDNIDNYIVDVTDKRNGNIFFSIKRIAKTSDYICTIGFTLPRLADNEINHNVYNVSTSDELEGALEKLKTFLGNRGIYINFDTTELYSVEVNNTITPEYEHFTYETYKPTFDLIERVCEGNKPKILKDSNTREIPGNVVTKLKWNDGRANVKFYNKKQQVISGLNIIMDKELIRCELTLKYKAIRQNPVFKDKNAFECLRNLDELFRQYDLHILALIMNAKANLKESSLKMLDILEKGYYPYEGSELTPYKANYSDINQLFINAVDEINCIENYLLACEYVYEAKNNTSKFSRDISKVLKNLSINNTKCLYVGHDMNYLFSSFLGQDIDIFVTKGSSIKTTKVKNALKKIDYKNR